MEARGPLWFWLLCLCTVRWAQGTNWYSKATANYYVTKKVVREVEFKKYSQNEKFRYLKKLLMSLDDDPLCDDDFYDEEDYIRETEPYYIPEWTTAPYGKVVVQKKSSLSGVKSVSSSSTTFSQVRSGLTEGGIPSHFPSIDPSGLLPPIPDPSLSPVYKPVDNNLWYRYYKTVISSGLPVTPYDIRTLVESISASNILIDAKSPYGPDALYGPFGPENPLNNRNPLSPNNPNSPYSPFNPDSELNPNNLYSHLNPYNPDSILSPINPNSPFSPDNLDYPFFDVNNILSLFNPNNLRSPFNPLNTLSPFSPNNQYSPFYQRYDYEFNTLNTDSTFSPLNPISLFSPINPNSPYNPLNKDSIYNLFNPKSPYNINNLDSPLNPASPNYYKTFTNTISSLDEPLSAYERTTREEVIESILRNPKSPNSSINPNFLYDPANPISPLHPDSPLNPANPLSAHHPDSLFNPANPNSFYNSKSILNPANPRSPFNPHSPIYQDTPFYNPLSLYSPLNPLSPYHADSLVNPLNPNSPFNIISPLHPSNPAYPFISRNSSGPINNPLYDASNPLSPFYPSSILNPLNPNSPFNSNSSFNPNNLNSPFHESNPLNPLNNPALNELLSSLSPDLRSALKTPDSIIYENQKSIYSPIAPFYQYDSRHNALYLEYIKYIYDLYGCNFPYEQLFFPYAPVDRQRFIDYLKTQYKDEVPPFWPYQRYQYYLPRTIISDTQYHLSNVYGENNPLGKDVPFGPYLPEHNDFYYKFIKYINGRFGSYFNYDSLLFSYALPKDRVKFYTFLKTKYEECPDLWPYDLDYWNDCSKFSNYSYPLNLYQSRTILPGQYPISPESPISPFFEYDEKYNDLYFEYLKYLDEVYGPTFPFDQVIFPHNPYARDTFVTYLKTQCKDKPNFWPYYDFLWKCPEKFYIYDREAELSTVYNPLVRDGPLGPYIPKYKDLYVKYIKYINKLYGPNYPYERLLFPEASYKARVEFIKCLKEQFPKIPVFWPYPQSFWDKPELIPSTNNIFEIEEQISLDDRQIRLSRSLNSIGYPLAEYSPFYEYDPDCNKIYVDYANYIVDLYGNNFPYSKLIFPYDVHGRTAYIKYLKTQPNCSDHAPKFWPYYPFEYLYYSDSVSLQDFRNLDYPSDFIPPFGPYISKYNQLYVDYIKFIYKHFNKDYRFETLLFPYASVQDRIKFITYLKSQFSTCPEFWPFANDVWATPDKIETHIFDIRSLYANPLNPSAVVNLPLPEHNPLADANNPLSPLNPRNLDSLFNPRNPLSPLSPYNKNSLLSPLNPSSPFYIYNPARPLPNLDTLSFYNPESPLSPFNPESPNSLLNPNNPLSPFYNNYAIKNSALNPQNPDSILSPFNPCSLLSPKNPASVYNPDQNDSPYNSNNPHSPYFHEIFESPNKYTSGRDLYRSGPVYDVNSANSPFSPYNPTSPLNTKNPTSVLNPRNPHSPLSPDNPSSPFYYGNTQSPIFNSHSTYSPFNPNNIDSPFNTENRISPFNPNNPVSPFYNVYQVKNSQLNPTNPKSILSPYNPASLLSPLNPNSPYNPASVDSDYNPQNVNYYYKKNILTTFTQGPIDNYYQESLVNPTHPYNPSNPESILNPINSASPLSPYNPDSLLNPKNSASPFSPYNSLVPNYDANNPRSLFNPYNPESCFNPENTLSIFNPSHLLYPFKDSSYYFNTLNADSPYSPLNSDSIYSPLNLLSVYNPKNINSIYNLYNPYSPYAEDYTTSVYSTSIIQKTPRSYIVNSVFGTDVYSSSLPAIDDFQNPRSPFNPRNPLSPYNGESPFNPSNTLSPLNPHSLFNPSNPDSPLNPLSALNPDNFNSPFNPNSPTYPGTPFFSLASLHNPLNPDSPFNKNSPVNPLNPNSPFNTNSPLNPLNPSYYFNQHSLLTPELYDSVLLDSLNPISPFNIDSIFNPENLYSPFSPYSEFNPENSDSPYNLFNWYSPLNPSNPNSPFNPNYVPTKILTTTDILSDTIVSDDVIKSPYDLLYRKNPFYQNTIDEPFNAIEYVDEYYRLNPYKYPKGPYAVTEPFDKYNDKYTPLYLEYLKYIIAKYGDNFPYEQLLFPYDKEARVTYVKYLKTCFTSKDAPSWFPYACKYWTNPDELKDISPLVIQYGPYNPLGFKAPFGEYDEKFNDLYYNYLLYKIDTCQPGFNYESLLFPYDPTSSLNYIDFLKTKNSEKPDWWPFTAAHWKHTNLLYTESFSEKALFVSDLRSSVITTIDPSSPYSNIAPFYKYDCKYNELYLDYIKFVHSLYGCNFPYEQLFFEYAPEDRKKFIDYVKSQYKDTIPPFWPYLPYQWILPNSIITGETFTPLRAYGADNPFGREVPFGPYLPEFNDLYCKYLKYINEKFGPYFEYDQLLFSYLSPKERVDYYTILKSNYEKQPAFWPYPSDAWDDFTVISHIPYRSLNLSSPVVVDPVYLPDPLSPFAPFYKYDSKYNDFYYDYIKCTYDIYGKDYPYERLLFPYNPKDRETFLKYLTGKCGDDVPDFWPYYPLLWKHVDKFNKYGSTVRDVTVSETVLRSGIFIAYIPKHNEIYGKYIKYINERYGPRYSYDHLFFPNLPLKDRVEFINYLKTLYSDKCPDYWPYPKIFWDKPDQITIISKELGQLTPLDNNPYNTILPEGPFYKYNPEYNELYSKYLELVYDLYGDNYPYSRLYFPYDHQSRSTFIQYLKTLPDCKDKAPKFWSDYPYKFTAYSDAIIISDNREIDFPSDFIEPFGPYLPKYKEFYVKYIKYINKEFGPNYPYESLLFPYASVEDRIEFITYLKSQFDKCPEYFPFTTEIWSKPDVLKDLYKPFSPIDNRILLPYNPNGLIPYSNVDDIFNPFSPLTPSSPYSPYNKDSLFNNANPNSLLNPCNPESHLSPLNPHSPFSPNNPEDVVFDASNPASPFNPYNPESLFNPKSTHSVFNPTYTDSPYFNQYQFLYSPISPFNSRSLFSPLNPLSPLSPFNLDSPYNPNNFNSIYNIENALSPYNPQNTESPLNPTSPFFYRNLPVPSVSNGIVNNYYSIHYEIEETSYLSPSNARSALSPLNPNSHLSPFNPNSPLSPDNPFSPLNPYNPNIAIFDSKNKYALFNPYCGYSPFNPLHKESLFNPDNPNSPFVSSDQYWIFNPQNPDSPLSPLNKLSLYNPQNPNSLYNPKNKNSLYNPGNPDSPYNWEKTIDTTLVGTLVVPSTPFKNSEYYRSVATGLPYVPNSPVFDPFYPDNPLLLRPSPFNPIAPFEEFNSQYQELYVKYICYIEEIYGDFPFDQLFFPYNPEARLEFIVFLKTKYPTKAPKFWPYTPIEWQNPLLISDIYEPKPYGLSNVLKAHSPFGPYFAKYNDLYYQYTQMIYETHGLNYPYRFLLFPYSPKDRLCYINYLKSLCKDIPLWWPYSVEDWNTPNNLYDYINYPERVILPSVPTRYLNPYLSNYRDPRSWELEPPLENDVPFPNSPVAPFGPYDPKYNDLYYQYIKYISKIFGDFFPFEQILFPYNIQARNDLIEYIRTQEKEIPSYWPFLAYQWDNPTALPLNTYSRQIGYGLINPLGDRAPFGPYCPDYNELYCKYIDYLYVKYGDVYPFEKLLFSYSPADQATFLKYLSSHYNKCPGWWPYSEEEWITQNVRTRSLLNPLYAPVYPQIEVIDNRMVTIDQVLEGNSPLTSPYAPFYTYNPKYNDLYNEYTCMLYDLYGKDFPYDQVLFSFSPDDTFLYVQYLKTKYSKQPDFWNLFPYQWENLDRLQEYPLVLRSYAVQNTFNGQIPFGPYQAKYNELYYKYIEYIYCTFGLDYSYEDLLFPYEPLNRVTFIKYLKTKFNKTPNWWPYGKFVWDNPDKLFTLQQATYAYNYLDDKTSLSQYRNYVFGLTDFVPYNPLGKLAPFGSYSPEYNELYKAFIEYTYYKFGRNFPYENLLFPENPAARHQFIAYLKFTSKTGQPDYWPYSKRNWDEPLTIEYLPISERSIVLPNEDPLGPYGPFGSYCSDYNKFYKDYIEYIYERNGDAYPYDSLLFPYSKTDRLTFIKYLKSCSPSYSGWWPYSDEAWASPELIDPLPYPYPGKQYPDYLVDIPFKRSNLATSPLALYGPLGEYKSKFNAFYYKYITYIYKRNGLDYPYELVLFPSDAPDKRIEFIGYLKSVCKEIPAWWPYSVEVWNNCELLKCSHTTGPYTLGPFAPFGHYSCEYDALYKEYIENLYSIYGNSIIYDAFLIPYEPLSRFKFAKYLGTVYKDSCPDWFIYGSEYWNDVQVFWGNKVQAVVPVQDTATPNMRSLLGSLDPDSVPDPVEDLTRFQGTYEFWEKYSPYKFDKTGLYQVSLFQTFLEGLEKERYNIYRSVIYPPDFTPYVKSGDCFDIVIVGASAAGCTLANRLSEVTSWKILLIEAGGDQPIQSRVPGLSATLALSDYDHGYLAEPSQNAGLGVQDGRIRITAGKSLGGSSAVQNILYQRGTAFDFENFASLGYDGWGYDETLKYFVKSEDYRSVIYNESIAVHGTEGYLPVSLFKNKENNLIRELLESSAQELGYPCPKDMSDRYVDVGFAELPGTVRYGLRFTAADAYLTPIAGKRNNLYVVKRSKVTKVIIDDNNVAKGVEYINSKGETVHITANKEVILTAGAIGNAKLLLLSGVGPKDELAKFNIPCKQELRVGENLKLSAQFSGPVMAFSTSLKRTIYSQELVFKYLINRIGPVSNIGLWSFTGYIDTLKNTARPDLEIHLLYFQQNDVRNMCKIKRAYNFNSEVQTAFVNLNQKTDLAVFSLSLVNPKSCGKVSLTSSDPLAPPLIDTGLLSDPEDLGTLMRGTDYVSRLEQTAAIRLAGGTLMSLNLDACSQYPWRSTQSWTCYIRQLTTSSSNPVGTVVMGSANDPKAVVTPDLCVKGIKGLRVADASVLPNAIVTQSDAISYMIGEKCADLVKIRYNISV